MKQEFAINAFMEEVMQQKVKPQPKKVFLILDNLRTHHSKIVTQWVEENKTDISLFHLPSYSPELNPDEYLNCDLKQGLSNVQSPKNVETLENNVKNHM